MAKVYDVFTNLDEDTLTEVAFEVMKRWIAFALGLEEIGGHRIQNPTGRYASSIRIEGRGVNHIAIIADAPEAELLEEGHRAVDLKQYANMAGRALPMHRGTGPFIYNPNLSAKTRNVWAVPRAAGFNGFARVPLNPDSANLDSWIIPEMKAWSTAQYLADWIRDGGALQRT